MGFNVLILEDSKTDARLLEQHLVRSDEPFDEIKLVNNKQEYEEALQSFDMDLILSDYNLINFDGLEAIRLKNTYQEDVPLIIVSATIGEENAVEIIKEGATDFLIKSKAERRLAQISMRAIRESIQRQKRRQAEHSQRQSRQRYQMLFNSSLEGILIGKLGEEEEIVEVNPAACKMLGFSPENLKQLKIRDLLNVGDPVKKKLTLGQNESFKGELTLKHNNGFAIPVDVSYRTIELEEGELRYFFIFKDIRDRKKMQEEKARDRRIQKLYVDIAKIVNQNIAFEESMKGCIECINEFLQWPVGHVFMRNAQNGTEHYHSLDVWYVKDKSKFQSFTKASESKKFNLDEGLIGKTVTNREPSLFSLSHEKEAFHRAQAASNCGLETGLMIPIVVGGKPEAVFEFFSEVKDDFDKKRKEVLESVTTQVGWLIERKKNLEKVENEKERYRLIAHNSTDMISRHTPQGEYLYVSPASEQLLGYKPEELTGKSANDFFHPDDLEEIAESYRKLLGKPGALKMDYRLKQKTGDWLWVETTSKTVRDPESGKVSEIQSSTRDISDRKEYEARLERQFKFNEKIINSLPELFFILSEKLSLYRVNEKFKETLGYGDEIINEMIDLDFIADDDRENALNQIKEAFNKGSLDIELKVRNKEGEIIPCFFSGLVTKMDEKKFMLVAGIDITERKKAEARIRESLEEKNVLLTEIHHRVKNNLAIVSGMMELQAFDSENEEVMKQLLNSQNRIKSIAIIHELLYESNNFSDIDINENIKKLVDHISNSIQDTSHIDLTLDVDEINLNVNQAIPCALILNELLTNTYQHAFKDRQEGEIQLFFTKKGNKVQLKLSDDGKGLPDDFDLGRPENVGFKIINVLTQQLNGELTYESDKEQGTEFLLEFEQKKVKGSASNIVD